MSGMLAEGDMEGVRTFQAIVRRINALLAKVEGLLN